jgi:hypothetical protein
VAVNEQVLSAVGAWTFLDAKLREFEAACYMKNAQRIAEVEENCKSALLAVMDARRALVERAIRDADRV